LTGEKQVTLFGEMPWNWTQVSAVRN